MLLLLFTPLSAQEVKFLDRNKMCIAAFGYNGNGWRHETVDGFSAMMNILGVHIDFGFNGEGNNEGNTGIGKYYGYKTSTWHIGYSIPACEWLKITPVVGSSKWAKGYYDGLDYTADGNGIHNKFYPSEQYKKFDYGVVISAEIAKFVVLYVNVERYNIGAGLGISFRTDSWWL